jgi:acetyl-CoA carboxylase carboxyl transferase subunit beta
MVDRALTIITRSLYTTTLPRLVNPPSLDIPAWQSVTASRRPERPGVRELLHHAATDVLTLNGTGQGENDPGLLLALARFGEMPCVLLGQDRHSQTPQAPLGPGALRQARRGMRLAADLDLPLVTVIDTAGAALSREAEERGLAGEIARCIADMVALEVPTVSVLLGQGTGGGALALVPADRILAAQHGWLSPLPPEGASAILHHDTSHAPAMAAKQGVRSADLLAHGIVDRVIPEYPDAAAEPESFCLRVGATLRDELAALGNADTPRRLAERAERLDRIGQPDAVLATAG